MQRSKRGRDWSTAQSAFRREEQGDEWRNGAKRKCAKPTHGAHRAAKKMGRMTMHAPQKKKKNLKALEAIADYPTNTQGVYDVAEEFVEEDCKENTKDSPAEYFYKKECH